MKSTLTLIVCLITIGVFAQNRKLPNIKLTTVEGKTVNIAELSNNGNPIVISFWATWCSPCKKQLNTIVEDYGDWQDETGVKLVAVSIDNSHSTRKVESYIFAKEWEYDVLLDPNEELKRAMDVNDVPYTFLIDGKGNIVWNRNNYSTGDEEELYEEIKKHTNK
jgi:peroxiredoxin